MLNIKLNRLANSKYSPKPKPWKLNTALNGKASKEKLVLNGQGLGETR